MDKIPARNWQAPPPLKVELMAVFHAVQDCTDVRLEDPVMDEIDSGESSIKLSCMLFVSDRQDRWRLERIEKYVLRNTELRKRNEI